MDPAQQAEQLQPDVMQVEQPTPDQLRTYVAQLNQQNVQLQQQVATQQNDLHLAQQQLAAAQVQAAAQAQAAQAQAAAAPTVVVKLKPRQPEAFSGTDRRLDVETWLFQVESYMGVVQPSATDPEKIAFAGLQLKEAALTWWRALSADNQLPTTWASFKHLMHKQFLPVNNVRLARDRLAHLKQHTSVRDYAFRLRLTLLEIPGIAEDEKLDRFIRGLKPHVRREVELKNPQDLETAIAQAEIIDMNVYRLTGSRFNPGPPPRRSYAAVASGPVPMDLDSMQKQNRRPPPRPLLPHTNGRGRPSANVSRSHDQLHQLCYYCHKPGHRIADCPQRPKDNAVRPVVQQSGGR